MRSLPLPPARLMRVLKGGEQMQSFSHDPLAEYAKPSPPTLNLKSGVRLEAALPEVCLDCRYAVRSGGPVIFLEGIQSAPSQVARNSVNDSKQSHGQQAEVKGQMAE